MNDLIDFQGDYFFTTENMPLNSYLEKQIENIKSQFLLLKLNQAPTLNPEVRIKIAVELSTGENYEREIVPFFIID